METYKKICFWAPCKAPKGLSRNSLVTSVARLGATAHTFFLPPVVWRRQVGGYCIRTFLWQNQAEDQHCEKVASSYHYRTVLQDACTTSLAEQINLRCHCAIRACDETVEGNTPALFIYLGAPCMAPMDRRP